MPRRANALFVSLALLATAAMTLPACSKSQTYSSETATAIPEFPNKEGVWVNGSPFSFASAKGDVVLVEAWHRQ